MRKYKTLIIFLSLVAIWSCFFSTYKFFLWWDLSPTLKPSLQTISWYLSLGSAISYLIWWAIAYTFLKKYLLFAISFLSLCFILLSYIVWISSNFFLWFIIIFLWILYWLWSVLKNILISIEIRKTWLPDTTINALVWISFVLFIIVGSVLWSFINEQLWKWWYFVIIFMLAITSVLSLFLDYDKLSLRSLLSWGFKSYLFDKKNTFINSMREYIPDMKYITKKYYKIIIYVSLLWAISTVVSQKAVEYSVDNFSKDASSAAFVLLYSAVWAIIWNIISMKMDKNRWLYLFIANCIFWVFIIWFPFFTFSFLSISIFAFVIWVFFWVSSNLLDWYFFKSIWEENKKEYGSSTYGLIMSIIIFIIMFLSSFLYSQFWFDNLMYILWAIILIIWFINFPNLEKWKN